MRGATLFSGGGGCESLLKQSIDFIHAVEYDPAIAAVYRQNHGDHIQVAKVEDVDYSTWGALDYLHASPVCKEYSQAKSGGQEGEGDMTSALAVVRCLKATQPRVFTLENVGAYQHGKAYRLVCQWLNHNGYMWHAEVLNSADFGVPQTRRRLILRAVKDSLLPGWPAPLPWVGWYAAIEDLIPTLPASKFADWQLARLPEAISGTFFLGNNGNNFEDGLPLTMRQSHEPLPSITIAHTVGKYRAFIVAQGCYGAALVTAPHDAPVFTVTSNSNQGNVKAWLVGGANTSEEHAASGVGVSRDNEPTRCVNASNSAHWRAWLSHGRVVKMTPRALARFQSLPDWYELPSKSSLACTIIGNMVPSLMMAEIVTPLL